MYGLKIIMTYWAEVLMLQKNLLRQILTLYLHIKQTSPGIFAFRFISYWRGHADALVQGTHADALVQGTHADGIGIIFHAAQISRLTLFRRILHFRGIAMVWRITKILQLI